MKCGGDLGGGFWAEHALEAGAGEADADYLFAIGFGFADVDNLALGFKIVIGTARDVTLMRNTDFEAAADADVESSAERSASPA
jgi:hypothetical protein